MGRFVWSLHDSIQVIQNHAEKLSIKAWVIETAGNAGTSRQRAVNRAALFGLFLVSCVWGTMALGGTQQGVLTGSTRGTLQANSAVDRPGASRSYDFSVQDALSAPDARVIVGSKSGAEAGERRV